MMNIVMPIIKKMKKMTFLTDKQMTRIKTGGDSLTRDSVPAKIIVKTPLKMPCSVHLILLGMTVR